MVHFFKNSISSILIGLLVFSTTPFSISKHFCQNKLNNISFFGVAKTCCEQTPTPSKKGLNETPCCHTENSFSQGYATTEKASCFQIKKPDFKPIKINGLHTARFCLPTVKNHTIKKIPPPRPLQNLQALFQVYRI